MKTNIFFAATVAHLASAQGVLDIQQVVDAPAVTATAPPQVKVVDYAAVEASLAAVLTASTAKTTGAPGKFRMKREPEADSTIGSWDVNYHLDSKFCRTFWFKPSCQKSNQPLYPVPPYPKSQYPKPDPVPKPYSKPHQPYSKPNPPSQYSPSPYSKREPEADPTFNSWDYCKLFSYMPSCQKSKQPSYPASPAQQYNPKSKTTTPAAAKYTTTTTTKPAVQYPKTTTPAAVNHPTTTPPSKYTSTTAPAPVKTDQCEPQPRGTGPTVYPDTVEAFLNFGPFKTDALNAVTPSGYTPVFQNLQAASQGPSYLTYFPLESYDTEECAAHCDATKGCSSFNVYVERSPSVNPHSDASNAAHNCPNPSSTTHIRCALHGCSLAANAATNAGQWRDHFHVVIAGSNGYSKPGAPLDVPAYNPPQQCPRGGYGNAAADWSVGDHFFPGAYDPDLCAIFARVQTATNKAAAQAQGRRIYSPCNSFNAFEVWDEAAGLMLGTYCKLFTDVLPVAWAVVEKETRLGKVWGLRNSWMYELSVYDQGKI